MKNTDKEKRTMKNIDKGKRAEALRDLTDNGRNKTGS